jgi:hypothetical protein
MLAVLARDLFRVDAVSPLTVHLRHDILAL